jgi:hypothetical protein
VLVIGGRLIVLLSDGGVAASQSNDYDAKAGQKPSRRLVCSFPTPYIDGNG